MVHQAALLPCLFSRDSVTILISMHVCLIACLSVIVQWLWQIKRSTYVMEYSHFHSSLIRSRNGSKWLLKPKWKRKIMQCAFWVIVVAFAQPNALRHSCYQLKLDVRQIRSNCSVFTVFYSRCDIRHLPSSRQFEFLLQPLDLHVVFWQFDAANVAMATLLQTPSSKQRTRETELSDSGKFLFFNRSDVKSPI